MMRERSLVEENRRLRRALEIIRDDAGAVFAQSHSIGTEQLTTPKDIARFTLNAQNGEHEFHNTLLRSLLLQYGRHTGACQESPCICGWLHIVARLLADTVPLEADAHFVP